MKQAFLIALLLQSHSLIAQFKEPVFYFLSKDSLVGVKDNKGKVIIPPKNLFLSDIKDGQKIPDGLIHFFEVNDTSTNKARSFGKIYDHKGKFLYRPYRYDNGVDDFREGLARFADNGKIGFVNRQGKKVIPAQFDFVEWFDLGTATFCMGCYFDTKEDSEHPSLKGGAFGMIDKQGKILIDKISRDNKGLPDISDSLRILFYPNYFKYSAFEKSLLNKLNGYKSAIEKKYFESWSDSENKSLSFDIVERPSENFPWYIIESREMIGKKILTSGVWDGLHFYISRDGNKMFFYDWPGELIPFFKWYKDYIKN